jgi:hypothetical protein
VPKIYSIRTNRAKSIIGPMLWAVGQRGRLIRRKIAKIRPKESNSFNREVECSLTSLCSEKLNPTSKI